MQNTGDITRAKSLSFDTHPNVRIYEGDMDKIETLSPAMRRCKLCNIHMRFCNATWNKKTQLCTAV